jgi:hypothetical protein
MGPGCGERRRGSGGQPLDAGNGGGVQAEPRLQTTNDTASQWRKHERGLHTVGQHLVVVGGAELTWRWPPPQAPLRCMGG